MQTTINLSSQTYKNIKKAVKDRKYGSIDQLVEDAVQQVIGGKQIVEEEFSQDVIDRILAAEKEPEENDTVLETEEDIHNYFLHLKKPKSKK